MAHEPSLFRRLTLRMSVILAVGVGVLGSAAWYYARIAANDTYDRLLLGAALQISDNLTVESGEIIVNLPNSAFQLLGLARNDRIFYRIVSPFGETLTGYNTLLTQTDITEIYEKPVLESGDYKGAAVRIAIVGRALSDPTLLGYAHVIVAQTTEARRSLAYELTLKAAALLVAMTFLALMGIIFAIRYSLQPVKELGRTLQERDPHNLTPVDVSVPKELQPFVHSINHFMLRLEERVSLLQRFIADAAHQIRTPLTALSAQLTLFSETKLDKAGIVHLEKVQQRVRELAHLTNQLLSHAMVIHRADSIQLKPVDLVEITRRAFRTAVPITIDPDIIVSFEATVQTASIMGDAVSLREAIVNVIDNALRHGTQLRLDVRVCAYGETITIEVEDDGPGIPPEQWQQVTRRFETSKSGEGSAGLGFAIASEVAKAHGGSLTFRAREENGRGFRVVLEFPIVTTISS